MITGSCWGHLRIHCVTSLAIIRSQHLTFTTTLPPQRSFALSCMIALYRSLLPFPAPIRLPRPYLPHFASTKASRMCHRLTTSAPFRQPSKASAFLLPHQIQPPLVQYETLSPQV